MSRTERRAGAIARARATRRTVLRRAALTLAVIAAVLAVPGAASASSHPFRPAAAARTAHPAGHAAAPDAAPGAAQAAPPARPALPARPQGTVCEGLRNVLPGVGNLCNVGQSTVSGLNDLCSPGPPTPEPADGGIDSMIRPPSSAAHVPQRNLTLYESYGMAGQSWAPYDLKCSDMTSLMGNTVAGSVFDAAKAIDRIVISTYQSAAGEGLLGWLKSAVDRLITQIGNAIYFPYLAPVVLLGAAWLAWQGLIRRRATRTLEGTIWMVVACVAAIWLIGRPADFTGVGQKVSDGVTQVLNVAFSRLPVAGGAGCVPVHAGDPQSSGESFAYTGGNSVVNQNADELWSVLSCKPWLAGEFGTTSYSAANPDDPVSSYGRQLLWAQAIAANERPTSTLITQKTDTYLGIANSVQKDYPAAYPVFQGKQWPTRLEIGFSALFAALIAGVLVLLISITLIILKIGFLLLLVAGPFFLIIGTHPGFGRVIAIRWFELLVGVLMKQVAVALALSVLLYAYALVMAASDNVLPWALKILMIALLTVAVFIYRRPFQHLFASVGYQAIGSRDRAEADLSRARTGFRARTLQTATATLPGFGSYRVNRWARRNPDQADQARHLAGRIAAAMAPGAGAAAAASAASAGSAASSSEPGRKDGRAAPDLAPDGAGDQASGPGGRFSGPRGRAQRAGLGGGPGGGGRSEPPPLNLPRRPGRAGAGGGARTGPGGPAGAGSGGAGSAGAGPGGGPGGGSGRAGPARASRWQPGPYLPAGPGGAGTGGAAAAARQRRVQANAREAEASARRAEASSRRAEASSRRLEDSARRAESSSRQSDARSRRAEASARRPASWVRPVRRDE